MAQFISYYPTYEILDRAIGDKIGAVIYIDLQNCISGVYREDSAKLLLTQSSDNQPSLQLFLEWLDFVNFFYKYALSRTKAIRLIAFWDKGDSQYHRNIYKDYKKNRHINKYKIAPFLQDETLEKVIDINLENISRTARFFHNVFVVKLDYIESDFVPWYVINDVGGFDKISHIIFSRDNDMLQTLVFPSTYMFVKNKQGKLYDASNWWEYIKLKEPLDVAYMPYIKAVIGDKTDYIPGIKGLGWKKLTTLIKKHNISIPKTIEQFIDDLGKLEVKAAAQIKNNKQLIINNFKLVSFAEIANNISLSTKHKITTALNIKHEANLQQSMQMIDLLKARY